MNKLVIHIGSFSLIAITYHAVAQAPKYSVSILGKIPNNLTGSGYSYSVNSAGQVAGTYDGIPVRWTGVTPSVLSGGGIPGGINSSGQIAGTSNSQAVMWTGGTETILNSLPTGYNDILPESMAMAINDTGQVVGASIQGINTLDEGVYQAVRWTGSTATELENLIQNGVPYTSVACGINSLGQSSGYSQASGAYGSLVYHAVRWTGITPTDLGTLNSAALNSYGIGINSSGQVAGRSETGVTYDSHGDQYIHAVLWSGATSVDLGTLGGGSSSAVAVNDSGEVVGMSETASGGPEDAFLFESGTMYDLNSLIVNGSEITDIAVEGGNCINNNGQIAAYGTINGITDALLLTPVVPEPSTAILAMAGAAVFGARRRKSP